MGYFRFEATPALRPFVESIWVQEDETSPPPGGWTPTRVLPTTMTDLIIRYGDPFVSLEEGASDTIPEVCLTGQWTRPAEVRATGKTGLLIVCLYPWGASHLFGCAMDEFRDRHIDAAVVLGQGECRRLRDRVAHAAHPAIRARATLDWLQRRVDDGQLDPLIRNAASRVRLTRGDSRVTDLAAGLGVSRRQLTRRFNHSVGLSPKAFTRIVRFQHALTLIRQGWPWSRLSLEAGYCDQSHLIREVSALAGFCPGRLSRRLSTSGLQGFFNNPLPEASGLYSTVYL